MRKTIDSRNKIRIDDSSQIPDDVSYINESLAFDIDESTMGKDFDSILFDESPIRE